MQYDQATGLLCIDMAAHFHVGDKIFIALIGG